MLVEFDCLYPFEQFWEDGRASLAYSFLGGLFEFADVLVGVQEGLVGEVHPGEVAFHEVHNTVQQAFEFVFAGERVALVHTDTQKPESSVDVVFLCLVDVLALDNVGMGELKINQEDLMLELPTPNQKVFGFDVPVHEPTFMDILNPLEHLQSQHQRCLEGEPPIAFLLELLEVPAVLWDHHIHPIILFEAV